MSWNARRQATKHQRDGDKISFCLLPRCQHHRSLSWQQLRSCFNHFCLLRFSFRHFIGQHVGTKKWSWDLSRGRGALGTESMTSVSGKSGILCRKPSSIALPRLRYIFRNFWVVHGIEFSCLCLCLKLYGTCISLWPVPGIEAVILNSEVNYTLIGKVWFFRVIVKKLIEFSTLPQITLHLWSKKEIIFFKKYVLIKS